MIQLRLRVSAWPSACRSRSPDSDAATGFGAEGAGLAITARCPTRSNPMLVCGALPPGRVLVVIRPRADVRPLRILLAARAPVGGFFRNILDLANGQADRGHHVGIIADSLTGGDRAEQALAEI